MRLAFSSVLDDAEVRAIHEASLGILERCGVKVHSGRTLAFLAEKGFPIDRERGVVRFGRAAVEDALARVPARFDVFGRDGAFAFTLGDGVSKIASGHNAVFWADSGTGETRPSRVGDVELFARLCERLPNIDAIGVPVMPQDVGRPETTLLHGVRACIENCRKPLFFSTNDAAVNRAAMAMARAAFAGSPGDGVYAISQLSPTSPLFWEEGVLDALAETVAAGVPVCILPEPNAGVSCPATLAGLLTMDNAECLSGIVLSQLLRPGARVMYGNSWTTTDMRTGAALVGSPETTVCRIAGAQMARFYRVPSHTTAPNSDNHAHDEQNAWEKMASLLAAVAAGNDLVVNCGMFATGMTCSHEQLVMDDEMAAQCKRIAAGIEVNAGTIAADLIERIGPAGPTYLAEEHTLRRLRSGEHHIPTVSVRGPRALWEGDGGPDTYRLARRKVAELAALPPAPFDPARRRALEDILAGF